MDAGKVLHAYAPRHRLSVRHPRLARKDAFSHDKERILFDHDTHAHGVRPARLQRERPQTRLVPSRSHAIGNTGSYPTGVALHYPKDLLAIWRGDLEVRGTTGR